MLEYLENAEKYINHYLKGTVHEYSILYRNETSILKFERE